MPELTDLPVEILQMIGEGCDFQSRFDLRSTSKLMKEVVDQSKFVLHNVRLEIRDPRSLRMFFQFANQDGNLTTHKNEMNIETPASMEKTAKSVANILKNAEIRFLLISLNKDFLQKVKENSKSPLKARKIYCMSKTDPFWICDKSYSQGLTCSHDDPNFFQEYKEILINLDEVELAKPMDITDQDVLSMRATQICLKSEKFSAEMVNQLLDKFIAKDLSFLRIENPKGNFNSDIKIPDGFSNPTKIEGEHEKIDGDKRMILEVRKKTVWFTSN